MKPLRSVSRIVGRAFGALGASVAAHTGLDREQVEGISFLAGLFLFVGGLILIPVLGTLIDSLYVMAVYLKPDFAPLANYVALARSDGFHDALRFTLSFVLVSVPLEIVLGLGIALILNEKLPGRGALRACVLIPWAIPAAVSGRIFELVYDYSRGAANWLAQAAGITQEPINWLGSDIGAFLAIVIADGWKTTPFVAIILLAGLSSINETLYDQARVDRASIIQRFLRLTLPLLKPVLVVALLFRTVQALRIFDVVYVLTGGGPGGATESLSTLAYQWYSAGDLGYGAAVSVVLFVIAVVIAWLYVRASQAVES